jgi:exosortase A-associated hydrolase 1
MMTNLKLEPQKVPPRVLPLHIDGHQSLGILVSGQSNVAVLMVSGGAQTRVGSHRMQQQLAEMLKQQHISSLRFDFPGYGDAEGQPRDFIQHATSLSDVLANAKQLQPQIQHWLLFGLCDGASAILLNQHVLKQSSGLILLNPWCRAEGNHAQTMVRFYYWQRFKSKEFWQKLLSGQVRPFDSLKQLFGFWQKSKAAQQQHCKLDNITSDNFLPQLFKHWSELSQPVLLVLSENDLTAQECVNCISQLPQKQQQSILMKTKIEKIAGANHTCSEAEHFDQFKQSIGHWLDQNFRQ